MVPCKIIHGFVLTFEESQLFLDSSKILEIDVSPDFGGFWNLEGVRFT